MSTKIEKLLNPFLKKGVENIKAGDTVKVYQKVKIGKQERIQIFEGLVLAKKHGKGISATITVRKIASGVGVEKVFPLHSPTIEKIEIVKRGKVKRAKLYYLRGVKGKKARLKTKEFTQTTVAEKQEEAKPAELKEELVKQVSEEKVEEPQSEEQVKGEEQKEEKPQKEKK